MRELQLHIRLLLHRRPQQRCIAQLIHSYLHRAANLNAQQESVLREKKKENTYGTFREVFWVRKIFLGPSGPRGFWAFALWLLKEEAVHRPTLPMSSLLSLSFNFAPEGVSLHLAEAIKKLKVELSTCEREVRQRRE